MSEYNKPPVLDDIDRWWKKIFLFEGGEFLYHFHEEGDNHLICTVTENDKHWDYHKKFFFEAETSWEALDDEQPKGDIRYYQCVSKDGRNKYLNKHVLVAHGENITLPVNVSTMMRMVKLCRYHNISYLGDPGIDALGLTLEEGVDIIKD